MVDNDSVTVDDVEIEDCVFCFGNYGCEFIKDILEYIGCNVEFV